MSDPFLGQIMLTAINFNPRGWHACDGSLLPINQYTALFSLLGTTFGGNGQTNFALPDLRSRIPVCAGAGNGLSPYVLGQMGGVETISLNAQNIAPHTHPGALQVAGTRGSSVPPVAGNYLETNTTTPPSSSPTLVGLAGVTVQPNTGGVPFSVVQPYLALNYYIALFGIFPTRS